MQGAPSLSTTYARASGLTSRERGVAVTFLHNGGNAAQAYRAVSPHVTDGTAKVEGTAS